MLENFSQTMRIATLLWFVSACNGTAASAESHAKNPESTPRAADERAGEADAVEQRSAEEPAAQTKSARDDDASRAAAESEWSPESAKSVVERGRRKLGRRCDSGSQAACRAIPDLDKCANLQRANCASIGDLFARGATGVNPDPEYARDFWWKACDVRSDDCVRYGKLLYDTEELNSPHAVADRFFRLGCTRDFQLCAQVGRFYQEKQELGHAREFYELGCAAGQAAACREKK